MYDLRWYTHRSVPRRTALKRGRLPHSTSKILVLHYCATISETCELLLSILFKIIRPTKDIVVACLHCKICNFCKSDEVTIFEYLHMGSIIPCYATVDTLNWRLQIWSEESRQSVCGAIHNIFRYFESLRRELAVRRTEIRTEFR